MATSCDLEAARMAAEMDPAYEAARMAAEMVLQTMAPMTPGSLAAGGVRVAPSPPGKGGPPPPAEELEVDWNTWSEELQEWLPTGPCAFKKQWGSKGPGHMGASLG